MKINCMGSDKGLYVVDVSRTELKRLHVALASFVKTNPDYYKDEVEMLRQMEAALTVFSTPILRSR